MPASTFDTILAKGIRQGQIPARTSSARLWYRGAADKVSTTPRNLMQREKDRLVNNVGIGNMYAFFYDPKTKAKLPYYDRFPLIFPIKKLPDGFLGINMHYLPYQLRARLMDALYSITNNKKYDESTKLKISYDILNSASKFKLFKPTVKRYLNEKVKSRFLFINPTEWDIAIFLPVERFSKASKEVVFNASRKMIN